MLLTLRQDHLRFLKSQVPQLHRFLISCCWKHDNLIPQENLRNGLRAAEMWLSGKIDAAELDRLNYYAEAEAFAIDYAETNEQVARIEKLLLSIDELSELPFEEARSKLLKAVYFAEGAMIYSRFSNLPWIESLFTSEFLCADLLRKFVLPPL